MAARGSSRYPWLPAAALLLAGACLLGIRLSQREVPSAVPPVRIASDVPSAAQDDPSAPSEEVDGPVARGDTGDPEESEPNEQEGRTAGRRPIAPSVQTSPARLPLPGYVIRGRVLAQGGPIREEPGQWPRTLAVRVEAPAYGRYCRIDSDGEFECDGLEAGVYVVSVVSLPPLAGLLCEPLDVPLGPSSPSAELTLVLADEVPVGVTVLDQENLSPLARHTVVARPVNGRDETSARTDEQGCCILSLIPGRYWIDSYRRDGRGQGVDPHLVVVEPTSQDLVVQLLVPARTQSWIRGVLIDSRGNPVPGYVDLDSVAPEPGRQPADAFAIADPGFRDPDGLFGYAYDVSGQLARRFICAEEAWRDGMTVVLEPRARIVGRLRNADGSPIVGAQLALEVALPDDRWRTEDRSLFTPVVAGDGRFCLEGVPVGLGVRVCATAGFYRGRSGLLDLRPGRTHDAGDIVMQVPESAAPRGVVRGRVIDEHGEPLTSRVIWVLSEGKWAQGVMDLGWFWVGAVPTDRPVTIRVVVPGIGSGVRTTMGGDSDCLFQMDSQGWGLLDAEAPALVVDRWINHAPMTWEQLRGRVVLLAFRDLYQDSPENRDLNVMLSLWAEYHSRGLVVIAVYDHPSVDGRENPDHAVRRILDLFQGAPIAGCLDADSGLVADLMPQEEAGDVFAGATHSLYQVYVRPAMFLVDKQGKVRGCFDEQTLPDQIDALLHE